MRKLSNNDLDTRRDILYLRTVDTPYINSVNNNWLYMLLLYMLLEERISIIKVH